MTDGDWVATLREIDAAEGAGSSFEVLWQMLHARVFTDAAGSGLARLGATARTIWVANVFVGEVMNGGFEQFFTNTSGGHAGEVEEALARVGATRMIALYREAAAAAFPQGVPTDREQRFDAIERGGRRLAKRIDALDQQFYALDASQHPDLGAFAFAHADDLDFSREELLAALEHCPHLLFPGDRATTAGFDIETKLVSIATRDAQIAFPLADVVALHIAKAPRAPGASGLVYRFTLADREVDVPFFARGTDGTRRIHWFFPDWRSPRTLVSDTDTLAEARRDGAMEPVYVWSRDEGSAFL
jgi:hypothetical protein